MELGVKLFRNRMGGFCIVFPVKLLTLISRRLMSNRRFLCRVVLSLSLLVAMPLVTLAEPMEIIGASTKCPESDEPY